MQQDDTLLIENLSIIINSERQLYFCNRNNEEALRLIDELEIMDKIKQRELGTIFYNNYFVDIQEFNAKNETIYHIVVNKYIDKKDYSDNSIYIDITTGFYNKNFWESINMGIIKVIFPEYYGVIALNFSSIKKLKQRVTRKIYDNLLYAIAQSVKNEIGKEDIAIRYKENKIGIFLSKGNKTVIETKIKEIGKRIDKKNCNKDYKLEINYGSALGKENDDFKAILQKAEENINRNR
ncbi:MAG TPA: diguanylate cyclase [Clostridiaceae bacterium]